MLSFLSLSLPPRTSLASALINIWSRSCGGESRRVQQLIAKGEVLVGGGAARASLRLKGGEEITVTGAPHPPPLRALAEEIRSTSSTKTTIWPLSTSLPA